MENLTLGLIREKKSEKEIEFQNFLEAVKKEMVLNNIYYKKAKFQCYSDGIFTYAYSTHSNMFEFSFICDDTLIDKMTIKELLELKNIKFYQNRIFDKKTMNLFGSLSFSILG